MNNPTLETPKLSEGELELEYNPMTPEWVKMALRETRTTEIKSPEEERLERLTDIAYAEATARIFRKRLATHIPTPMEQGKLF